MRQQGTIVQSCPRHLGPPWTRAAPPSPHVMDPVHRIFGWNIILKSINPCHFAKRPLFIFNINPQSTNFQGYPRIFENNSRYTPSHFPKITNKSPKFSSPYHCNRNSDFGDSCAKILRIFHSFISCIHNICLLHID
jgi:hypothetical protein